MNDVETSQSRIMKKKRDGMKWKQNHLFLGQLSKERKELLIAFLSPLFRLRKEVIGFGFKLVPSQPALILAAVLKKANDE